MKLWTRGNKKLNERWFFLPYCELWSRPTLAFFFLFSFLIWAFLFNYVSFSFLIWAFLFLYVFALFQKSFLINIFKPRFGKKYSYQHQLQHFAFFLYPLIWMLLFLRCFSVIFWSINWIAIQLMKKASPSILLIWTKVVASCGHKLYPLRINPTLREG